MEIAKLVETLGRLNIYLQVQGSELKIKGSKENLTPVIVDQIRQHKTELITYLGGAAGKAATAIPVIEPNYNALYPLSSPQRRLWVMSQVAGSGIAYNIPGTYIFKGRLDTAALARAFEQLIARHESLRTVFVEDEQREVSQRILSAMPFTINYHDLQQAGSPEDSARLMVQQTLTTPFDLSSGPLLRAALFQLSASEWIFTYVMHHIISDGWSMGVLIRELLALYNAYTNGADHSLSPLRIQYKDYTAWQQQQLSGASLQGHKSWWLKQFEGDLPVLELPADNLRPAVKTFNGKIINRRLNAALTAELKAFCRQQDATLFMGLLAAVNTLLHRYTGQEDIVIGSPIAGRNHADLEGQIGFYVNTLAFRTRIQDKQTFAGLLAAVKDVTLKAYEHQSYPFDELVNELHLHRDMSRHPLFDVMMVLQNAGGASGEVNGLTVEEYKETESLGSKFDWLFIFNEAANEIQASIEYNTDIYNESTLTQAWAHFEQLLAAIIAQPQKPIAELEYLSTAEKNRLLVEFNDTAVEYPKEKTIAALFEEQAAKTPGKIALVFGENKLSYREVNEQANSLAAHLLSNYSIQPDDLIAIKLERSGQLIITILAVLKTGAAYVPIDPSYPQDRIDYMIADSNCRILIDEQMLSVSLPACGHNPVNAASSSNLAYVMYTSGSTGRPKGVMVEHGSVVRLVKSAKYAPFTGNETLLSTGAVSFDATTFEYWGMLLNGGTLVLCSLETLLDANQLSALIKNEQVDTMWFTAGWFNQLVDKDISVFNGLRTILAGGDKLSPAHVNAVLEQYPGIEIINGYGPTENTTFSLTYSITSPQQVIPVGKPISNSSAYIIDKNNQLCPVGVVGEICVGGDGLARGYLNQSELTAEKFVCNPFAAGSKMYRTGDLGRWLADGNILFEGRKDDQVKIRGYRIEPGEIAAVIQNCPGVESVVVITVTNAAGEKELAAYIVANDEVTVQGIRSYAAKELPAYMVPSYFVQLDELPLTPNGKVDRKNLPGPVAISDDATYVAPRNEVEEKLALIWQEILGRERIGAKDHFFECGGHSLKLTRLSGQLQKAFEVTIPLKDLFSHPVLEQQAELINNAVKTNYQLIPALPPQEHYALSAAQRRMWILSQFSESNIAYNVPSVYEFEGSLDTNALEYALHSLTIRHESLRTVFRQNEAGEVRQYILPSIGSLITYYDTCTEAAVQNDISRPFDLATGPLLRASLYRAANNTWIFVYTMHHIISDGWSMGVLMNELLLFYNERVENRPHGLQPLRIQYKDYAAWQGQQLSGASLQSHKEWWLNQFEGDIPVLELPTDNARPAIKTFNGKFINKKLNAELTAALKTLCRRQDATLFMGLLAAVNTLLHRYTGQGDIVIGSPIAGRDHADLEGQIGFYVNTLALRTRFQAKQNFNELLTAVKAVTLEAYQHQSYPFDELVDELNLQRDLSRHPLFDVMLILQNAGGVTGKIDGLTVREYKQVESLGSKFDWLFVFVENGDELQASIEYNTDIYNEGTIEQAWSHFEQLLAAIAAEPLKPLAQLDYLSAAEKNKLLSEFNDFAVPYPSEKTIGALFEEQVAKTPGKTALVFEDNKLTYQELNEQANRFANYLIDNYRIQPDDLVALKLDRSDWLIIAILGVLKAGGAYVPLDVAHPADRIEYMVADTNCKVLIDEEELQRIRKTLPAYNSNDPVTNASARDLAYVMYTSGSTGKPKGVMVEHRGVVRLVKSATYAPFTGNESMLATAAVAFDVSTFEYWGMLLNGGKLVMSSLDTLLNPRQMAALIKKEQVDTMWFTAGWFHQLVDKDIFVFSGLQTVIAGGDKVSPPHVNALMQQYPGITVINGYGPTENTTFSLAYTADAPAALVPVGKPISNSTAYIIDKNNQLCPVGVVGEICVGGDGVARGYLNQPKLTAERFVYNPYIPGEIMYHTGDLGRWMPDGNILYIGRKDNQVKIRGFRLEPGEIEVVIQNHPAVESVIVIPVTNAMGEKELAAYFVAGASLTVQDIRNHVSRELPPYMVPAYFVQLAALPLTSNGKVDRKNLPDPFASAIQDDANYAAPRNEAEEKLVLIWQQVLGRERIGIKDHFFASGGHSLKLTRLSSQLQKVFEVTIALKDLFNHPVLEQQAELINNAVKTNYQLIPALQPQEHYALSAAQRRMWILSQFQESNIAYNIPSVYEFEGSLNVSALEYALQSLAARHESLRTVFRQNEAGEVRQYILPSIDASITYYDTEAGIQNGISQPFDLATGPLLRTSLCKAGNKWIFAFVMHHIISDGWSMGVLMNELLLFYNERVGNKPHGLQPLRIQYKDYAAWQQARSTGEVLSKQKGYWLKQFESPLPVLHLPQSKPRPARKSFAGAVLQKHIAADISTFCLERGSTLFMGLLAGVNALLYSYSKQHDIIIGTPIAGREHADLEGQVGLYINTLALRTRFSGANDFEALLSLTKEVTLGAYEHQSYPFDELVEQLRIQRNASRNALFDVMVVLQNITAPASLPNPDSLRVSAYEAEQNAVSAFDLTFSFIEVEDQLIASIEYNTDLFSKPIVLRMADHLEQLLNYFMQNPSAPLDSFNVTPDPAAKPATKKQKLLIDDLEL